MGLICAKLTYPVLGEVTSSYRRKVPELGKAPRCWRFFG